jgi:hypothetical protein
MRDGDDPETDNDHDGADLRVRPGSATRQRQPNTAANAHDDANACIPMHSTMLPQLARHRRGEQLSSVGV